MTAVSQYLQYIKVLWLQKKMTNILEKFKLSTILVNSTSICAHQIDFETNKCQTQVTNSNSANNIFFFKHFQNVSIEFQKSKEI